MIIIKNIIEESNLDRLRKLWNLEVGTMFPITRRVFLQNTIHCKQMYKEGSFIAINETNEVIGFILTKVFEDDERIPAYKNVGFISLFYVKKSERGKGIGSQLFLSAEKNLKSRGKTELWIGKDIYNYFPGIPIDFEQTTTPWLEKRQYECMRSTYDLINLDIQKYQGVIQNENKYAFRLAEKTDYNEMAVFFLKNFPGRWYYEFDECFNTLNNPNDFLIVLDQKKVIAFIRLSTPNSLSIPYHITWYNRFESLGGLGPLGVDKEYRGQNLGSDIVIAGILELQKRYVKEVIIDWTSLLDFYKKFGFYAWKSYRYTRKEL